MGGGFAGTCLKGPNVFDLISTHQHGGGLVDVGLDLQKGGRQSFMVRQPAINQISMKIIQFRFVGEVLIIRGDRDKGISNSCLKAECTVVTPGSKGWLPQSPLFRYMTKSSLASQGLLILLQILGENPSLVIRGHALPIHHYLSSRSTPFVFKLFGHAPMVGQAFYLLQLRLVKTTLDSRA